MIPIFKPSYGEEEINAIKEVLNSGWTGTGKKTQEFEEKFAEYIGVKHALALNSCTAALHLAGIAVDIGQREVLTTPLTFISTNNAILYSGGIPVFCDIKETTLNIDPEKLERNITKNTRAIMVVHYGGNPCDMDRIKEIADKYKLFIIEDSAHACGSSYRDRKTGSIGDIGCFSFHAVKNLSISDGGMLTTNDTKVYKRLKKLSWLGIDSTTWERNDREKYSWDYEVEEIGYKYHLNDLLSAIGIEQLKKLDEQNRKRRFLYNRYKDLLRNTDLELPIIKPDCISSHHNFVVKTDYRDELNSFLQKQGIASGVHYKPNYYYRIYRGFKRDCEVVEKVWKKLLTLPLYPDLTLGEQDYIVDCIKRF